MAFKITAAKQKQRDAITTKLREKGLAIIAAVKAFNEEIETAREFINHDLVGAFDDDYNEKSEKWQEGDTGTSVRAWIDALDEAGTMLEDIDEDFDEEKLEEIIAILDDLEEEPES
ncbi:hypothetical protein [Sphingobium sp. MK2]|uniref:hypothetical protein n=1 Tax=Sphingobium sp. MK2 TaxID=3116540 RepID=UPI0032E35FFB